MYILPCTCTVSSLFYCSDLYLRYYVISQIPKLVFLDDVKVSAGEREEACRAYGPRMRTNSLRNGSSRSFKSVSKKCCMLSQSLPDTVSSFLAVVCCLNVCVCVYMCTTIDVITNCCFHSWNCCRNCCRVYYNFLEL